MAAECATEAFQSHLYSTYRGLWGLVVFPVVVAQWQSTGCTNQVAWVRFPATAVLFTQSRPNWCMMLHIHKEKTDALQMTSVGNEFTSQKEIRVCLFGQFQIVELSNVCVN